MVSAGEKIGKVRAKVVPGKSWAKVVGEGLMRCSVSHRDL